MTAMNEDRPLNVRDMIANYVSLARRAGRYWKRAFVLFVLIAAAGMAWVVTRVRLFKSEASAAVHDVSIMSNDQRNPEEAQADLRARLDQVYGSRANLGRVVDELRLYDWMRGRTSQLKVIESFRDAMSYTAAGRDAFRLEFVYRDRVLAQRAIQRLLQLYTDERRSAGQMSSRNDLASVDTAINALEGILSEQESRLDRFEHANHDMVEQVRLRRMGQQAGRLGLGALVPTIGATVIEGDPRDSTRTHRLRIRLGGLAARRAALQRSLEAPVLAPVAATATPVEESERLQTMRRTTTELRERLARLRTTYTDEYPDVRVTIRRLADAERDLAAAVATDRASRSLVVGGGVAVTGPANIARVQAQLDSIQRETESTRSALAAAVREDRERDPTPAVAPALPGTATATARRPAVPSADPDDALLAAAAPSNAREGSSRPLGSLVEVEATWDRLAAELGTTRTRYQTLLNRKFELQATLDTINTTGSDVLRVIDPPSLPVEPEPPGRTKLALMVLAAALLAALGVAGLSGFLDTRVYEPVDLQRWGELPELPVIPDLREYRTINVNARVAPNPPTDRPKASHG